MQNIKKMSVGFEVNLFRPIFKNIYFGREETQ